MRIVIREIVQRTFEVDAKEFEDWFDRQPDEYDDGDLDEICTHPDNWESGAPPAYLVEDKGACEGWREIYEVDRPVAVALTNLRGDQDA